MFMLSINSILLTKFKSQYYAKISDSYNQHYKL